MKFLMEVGTEELPAAFLPAAQDGLAAAVQSLLESAQLQPSAVHAFSTPRRLAVLVEGLAPKQPTQTTRSRGPSLAAAFDAQGQPTRAALGFAKSMGLKVEELEREEGAQGTYLFATKQVQGRATSAVLAEGLPKVLEGLAFPRTMRWGQGQARFARPIRWLVALLDDQVVDFEVFGLKTDRLSWGHRVLGAHRAEMHHAQDYEATLRRDLFVQASREARRQAIVAAAEHLAEDQGLTVLWSDRLLDEVVDLVEWPAPLLGRIDAASLALPRAVLITSMAVHQRYFATEDAHGVLAPFFVVVTNGGDPNTVRQGNEKVLRARLADAAFFYEEDRRRPLADRVTDLANISYHERLGTLGQRAERLAELSGRLAEALDWPTTSVQHARRAGLLAKSDQSTMMVREFPELEGTMGAVYAALSGEPEEVAQALAEQYLPAGAEGPLPESACGALLALADRADGLLGGFLAQLKPTGSQDPYALRRQAVGLIRLLSEKFSGLRLDLVLREAGAQYTAFDQEARKAAQAEIVDFVKARLQNLLQDGPWAPEVIQAVLEAGFEPLGELRPRLDAVQEALGAEGFADLLAAYRRASRLAGQSEAATPRPERWQHPAEEALARELDRLRPRLNELLKACDYRSYLQEAATIRTTLDAFFDAVLVMDEDPKVRAARLGLLREVAALLGAFARLDHIGSLESGGR